MHINGKTSALLDVSCTPNQEIKSKSCLLRGVQGSDNKDDGFGSPKENKNGGNNIASMDDIIIR